MSLEKLEAADEAADLQILSGRLLAETVPAGQPLSVDAFTEAVGRAWMMGANAAMNVARGRRTCRVCGCWEYDACEDGCSWVEIDLCSACVSL